MGIYDPVKQFIRMPDGEEVMVEFRRLPSSDICLIKVFPGFGSERIGIEHRCENTGWQDEMIDVALQKYWRQEGV